MTIVSSVRVTVSLVAKHVATVGNEACPHPPAPPQTTIPVEEQRAADHGCEGSRVGTGRESRDSHCHTPLCPGGQGRSTIADKYNTL